LPPSSPLFPYTTALPISERSPSFSVDRDTDEPSRQRPLVLVARGEECGVRSAEPERHTESLRVPDDDVRSHLAGRHEQRQREEIDRKSTRLNSSHQIISY